MSQPQMTSQEKKMLIQLEQNKQLIRECREFPVFAEFVSGVVKTAAAKGQGELPAHLTAIKAPIVVSKRHDVYSATGLKAKYAAQDPTEVDGYMDYIAFKKTAVDAKDRAGDAAKPAMLAPGTVTLTVGCTYFFVHEDELRLLLETATGGRVLGLRPKTRRGTQRTGLWFVDVAAADVPAFLVMDRCMLMHHEGTFVYTTNSQQRLRAWTDARDAATMAVDPTAKGMKPMTIEPSHEFKAEVEAIMAKVQ